MKSDEILNYFISDALFLRDEGTFHHECLEWPVNDLGVFGGTSVQAVLLLIRDSSGGHVNAGVEADLADPLISLQKLTELETKKRKEKIF